MRIAALKAGPAMRTDSLSSLRDSRALALAALAIAILALAPIVAVRYLPLHDSDTVQQGDHVFRTCFPGPDPRRDFCIFARTDEPVLILRVDPDQRPNATVDGPDNPGRQDG